MRFLSRTSKSKQKYTILSKIVIASDKYFLIPLLASIIVLSTSRSKLRSTWMQMPKEYLSILCYSFSISILYFWFITLRIIPLCGFWGNVIRINCWRSMKFYQIYLSLHGQTQPIRRSIFMQNHVSESMFRNPKLWRAVVRSNRNYFG
jgi:hypothetical protein